MMMDSTRADLLQMGISLKSCLTVSTLEFFAMQTAFILSSLLSSMTLMFGQQILAMDTLRWKLKRRSIS